MKEWARRMACVAAGAMVTGALVLLTTVLCAEVAEVRLLGVKLGFSNAALLSAIVIWALAWPMTINFLISTARIKAQFVRPMASEGPAEPREPEDTQTLARVRRQERKELLWVCSGIIAFLAVVALLATALPGVRWRGAPHKQVPPAVKRPTALIRQGKHEEAIPLLLEALQSHDFLTSQAAADALVELGETAIPGLGDALARGYNYGGIFDMVLSKMGPAAIGAYTEGLKSKNKSVQRMVMLRIAQMGAQGIPGLREALKDNDQIIRYQAIEALRKTGAPAVPVLKEAVDNSDPFIRTQAIAALWQIAAYDTAAVEALGEVLEDQSGKSLLHYAAEAGNADAIERFIKEGADLNAEDASGNTPLVVVFEKMMMPTGRRGGNYVRYKEAAELLIAKGANVNARGKFGRTLLERARAQGRGDMAKLLVAGGAKTHFDRRIYFKLPLEGVRFHWKFIDRAAYLSGHLILRISGKDESPMEVTVFKEGKVADNWRVIGEGSRTPTSGGAYFGFESLKRYVTAKGDDVEIELHVTDDLPGGWGSTDQGILPKGIYKAKGKINMVSNEPRTLTAEGKQIKTSDWTAFLKWHTAWELLRGQASGAAIRGYTKMLDSRDTYARQQAALALGRLGDQTVAPSLIRAMKDADKKLRAAISTALGQLGNPEVYVLNAQGGNPVNLTQCPASDYAPAWSPDGTKIAFTSNRDGDVEIYVMETDGSNQTRLTRSPGSDAKPTWSPDGTRLAFQSQRDKNCEIYLMNADGTVQVNVTNSSACDHDPTWSPDGGKIAFQSTRNNKCDIYITHPDGTGVTNVTSQPGCDHRPAWSPDGTKIAFSAKRVDRWGLYFVNLDSSYEELLLPGICDASITWSPDGKLVAFSSDHATSPWIFVTDDDGSSTRILTELAGLGADPAWSPDGTRLALTVNIFVPSILPQLIEASRTNSGYEQIHDLAP